MINKKNLTSPSVGHIAFIVYEHNKSSTRELLITEDETIAIAMTKGYNNNPINPYFDNPKQSSNIHRWYDKYEYCKSGWTRHYTEEEIQEIMQDIKETEEYERRELEATGMRIMNMMDGIHGNDAW